MGSIGGEDDHLHGELVGSIGGEDDHLHGAHGYFSFTYINASSTNE